MGSYLSSLWRQAFSAFSALLPSLGGESLSESTVHKSRPPIQGENPGGAGPSHHNNAGKHQARTQNKKDHSKRAGASKPELKSSSEQQMSDGGEQANDPPRLRRSKNTPERYKNYDTEIYRGTILCRCCATPVPRERPSIQPCGCNTVCEECAYRKYAGDKICPACGIEMSSKPKMVGRFQNLDSLYAAYSKR